RDGAGGSGADPPRQVANTHTFFSVAGALVLIWFTGPLAKLAELVIPARRAKEQAASDPRYLDEASLEAPSLGLQKARLETARLAGLVLDFARRGPVVGMEDSPLALEAVRT